LVKMGEGLGGPSAKKGNKEAAGLGYLLSRGA